MNSDQLKGKWKQVKGSVKARWGKLTDDDLEVIDGQSEQLIGTIQERYGIAREAAQKQVDEWNKSLARESDVDVEETNNFEERRKASESLPGEAVLSTSPFLLPALCGGAFCRSGRGHLHLDNIVLDSIHNQIANRLDVEFAHDVAAMCLRSLGAQVQKTSYFLRAFSLRQELNHFALARGQCRQPRRLSIGRFVALVKKARQHHIVHAGGKEHAVALQRFHR